MSISAPANLKKSYSKISKLYSIAKEDEGKVWMFLDHHQSLISILESVPSIVNKLFPAGVLYLFFEQDPEIEDYKFLRIKVISNLSVSEALSKKEELNEILFDQYPAEILFFLLITICSK